MGAVKALSQLDARFPLSANIKKVSSHIIRLDGECDQMHRERLKVETSELARDVRGGNDEEDDLLQTLESI